MEDCPCLINNNIITVIEPGRYKWNCSLTSLGEYFKSLERLGPVSGGFWNPIENLFSIKRGTLRHLANDNGRSIKKKSKDYEKILDLLQQPREQIQNNKKFNVISLLINKTDQGNPEEIKNTLMEIKNCLQ
jgi:hypothetical protein